MSCMFPAGTPRIGLGLAALGRPGYINLDRAADIPDRTEQAMRGQAEKVLDAAWANGVRWFDAARSYGLAEDFLGTWLRNRGHAADQVVVTSKWGYRYAAGWRVDCGDEPHEVKDHSLSHLQAQIPETVDAVGEFVNLYQVHSATFESGILTDQAVHRELAALRSARGWRIGLSVSGVQQAEVLEAALKIEVDEQRLFDVVQCTYNVFEQAPHTALCLAAETGVAVIVKEAMANGRVLSSQPLIDAATAHSVTPDALALACVLAQPFQPFVLSGAATPGQLESNLAAEALAEKLRVDRPTLEALMRATMQESQPYWTDRGSLSWN